MADPPPPAPDLWRWPRVVLVIAALNVVPELVLWGADLGLWGSSRWRSLAQGYGAFWSGLWHGWTSNIPGQAVLMVATYAWLHAGPGHLLGNVVVLLPLGREVHDHLGTRGVLAVYGAGLVGGAMAFGLMSSRPSAMVGASGAIFGLAGGLIAIHAARGLPRRTVIALVVGALALNAVSWWLAGGRLAWEAHLGGLAAGGLAGRYLMREKMRS